MKKISNIKTALRYAEAMYDSSADEKERELLYSDACNLSTRNDLSEIAKLNNPLWRLDDKTDILTTIAARLKLCPAMLNTLKILAENNKLNVLPQILQQFVLLYQQKHDIAEVEVTTVTALSTQQEQLLRQKLGKIFQKEIILKYVINPQIIGGLVIKYGTNFIDNSVRHKLNALENLMKGTK